MFYDPIKQEVLDFVGGKEDLQRQLIRTIGRPEERFEEDRLRMIRAIRFAYRLNFLIEDSTRQAILGLSHTLLPSVSMERIWQELTKIRQGPHFAKALIEMSALGLLGTALPPLQGTASQDIAARLKGLDHVSEKVPTILILAELFRPEDIAFVLGLGIYMRASKEETKWIETLLEIRGLWQQDGAFSKRYEWAQLLANKRSKACFEVLFCKLQDQEKQAHFARLQHFEESLASHIDRLHKKKPLCQAKDLQTLGISPGKKMGQLLHLAERLAIEHDLHSRDEVIDKLRQDPSWIDSQ